MRTEIFETLSQLTENTVKNCQKCGEANLELGGEMLQQQTEFASNLLEVLKNSAGKAAGAKDVQSIVANQAECAQDIAQLIWASSKNCAELLSEAAKSYNQLFESGLKSANTNFDTATKTAAGKGRKGKASA
jgi:hypothetical protein